MLFFVAWESHQQVSYGFFSLSQVIFFLYASFGHREGANKDDLGPGEEFSRSYFSGTKRNLLYGSANGHIHWAGRESLQELIYDTCCCQTKQD